MAPRAVISAALASIKGRVIDSAWKSSIASITPETRAASRSSPFPCETVTERELGRVTMTTGIPILSNPVTLATRVIPNSASRGLSMSKVARESRRR